MLRSASGSPASSRSPITRKASASVQSKEKFPVSVLMPAYRHSAISRVSGTSRAFICSRIMAQVAEASPSTLLTSA